MKLRWLLAALCGCGLASVVMADELVDTAALDPTFGDAGKVVVPTGTGNQFIATDVAAQADGKLVVVGSFASTSIGFHGWAVGRLNVDGSLDTSFNGGTGFEGLPNTNAQAGTVATGVAIRPNGKIVVAGTLDLAADEIYAAVVQLNADGSVDNAWGGPELAGGHIVFPTFQGDTIVAGRMILQSDGAVVIAGTYYQQSSNNNNFFFDRVAADGASDEPFQFIFGGPNADDHAFGVAIDQAGRYLVSGYHRGAGGNYDCAVIRVDSDLYDVDRTFGYRNPNDYGYQLVAFDYGGDNNDSCNEVAVQSDYIILGGNATKPVGGGTYQAAVLAMLDASGALVQVDCVSVCINAKFAFAYDQANAGAINTIAKLIVDPYETKYPYVYAIGSGRKGGSPHGTVFGVARIEVPAVPNSVLDPTFHGGNAAEEYFITRPDGIGLLQTANEAYSAVFARGKLVVVGSTDTGTTDAALARFAAFDGIFKNGVETPYF